MFQQQAKPEVGAALGRYLGSMLGHPTRVMRTNVGKWDPLALVKATSQAILNGMPKQPKAQLAYLHKELSQLAHQRGLAITPAAAFKYADSAIKRHAALQLISRRPLEQIRAVAAEPVPAAEAMPIAARPASVSRLSADGELPAAVRLPLSHTASAAPAAVSARSAPVAPKQAPKEAQGAKRKRQRKKQAKQKKKKKKAETM